MSTRDPVIREAGPEAWSSAAPVAARAFFEEEFVVAMLGREPLSRWVDVHRLYATEPFDGEAMHLVAYLDDLPVGLIRASAVGRCHVCRHVDPGARPQDELQAREWEFEVEVLRAHERQAEHGWISRVAVEPQLHGTGIGSRLVDAALELLGRGAGGPVLLECLAPREVFYARRGFTRVDEIDDPYADTTYLMRAEAAGLGEW